MRFRKVPNPAPPTPDPPFPLRLYVVAKNLEAS